jgi:WD40 repeat protein/serine/threonine protein kinase
MPTARTAEVPGEDQAMTLDEQLVDLLVQAEEWQQEGRPFRVAELCPDQPELWATLEQVLTDMRRLDGVMHVTDPTVTAAGETTLAAAQPPLVIPGYEIEREQGHGGMGIVYRARQLSLNRIVALKVMRQYDLATPEQLLRFRMEAELAARVEHPHIVQVYEVGAAGRIPYIAMEWVPDGSLADYLIGRPQDSRQAAALVETLARAVHAAHAQGVIHRDLKPSNILLRKDEGGRMKDEEKKDGSYSSFILHPSSFIPKIADFGLARLLRESPGFTKTGEVLGTPDYLSPEQAAGKKNEIGVPADVHALGVLLYELLAGRPPFRGEHLMDTLRLVLEHQPPPLSASGRAIPRDLETICRKCLEKDPSKRYPSADALADDLRRWRNNEPIHARRVGASERLWRWCQRRPLDAALIAVLHLVALAGLAGIVWKWHDADQQRDRAVTLSGELKQERDQARWQSDQARWQSYRASLQTVSAAFSSHNFNLARQALDTAPSEYRGWEWQHFDSSLDSALKNVRASSAPVAHLAFRPDGKVLAAASDDGKVRLWDVASGEILDTWIVPESGAILDLQFSSDGKCLAATWGTGFTLWDTNSGAVLIRFTDPERPRVDVIFRPDSRVVVSSSDDLKHLQAWDVQSGKPVWSHRGEGSYLSPQFTPDGKWLAAAKLSGDIVLLDARSGERTSVLKGHKKVWKLAFSPDGGTLASGGEWPDNTVRLWDMSAGKLRHTLTHHKNSVVKLVFSPDGRRLASCSMDQSACLWDAHTGERLTVLRGHTGSLGQAHFTSDGNRLVTLAGDYTARVWDAASGDMLFTVLGWERHAAFHAGTATLAGGGIHPGDIRLWNLTLMEGLRVLHGHTSFVYDAVWSPNGAQIASGAWDGTVRLWDAATGKQHAVLAYPGDTVFRVGFEPKGRFVAAGIWNKGISVCDLAAGEKKFLPKMDGGFYGNSLVFHPAQPVLVCGSEKGPFCLWDYRSPQSWTRVARQEGNNYCRCFNKEGNLLATVHDSRTIQLWDFPALALQAAWKCDADIFGVAFSPDGRQLVTGHKNGLACVWDVANRSQIDVLKHPGGQVYGLSFHPDGKRLATASSDHLIRLWDTETWDEVAELHGHADYVASIAFSPDGTRLVSASGDHTVRLWDTLPLKERATNSRPAR